jgi:ribose 5-phosphate isomerase B
MENFTDMKITIGSDHRGYKLKEVIKSSFDLSWIDVGTDSEDRVDYPRFAHEVSKRVLNGEADRGILICGSGVGMSIAANRHNGIYAALCWSPTVARCAREHDNANILVLPADFVSDDAAREIVRSWLQADFSGGRYQERLEQVDRNF